MRNTQGLLVLQLYWQGMENKLLHIDPLQKYPTDFVIERFLK